MSSSRTKIVNNNVTDYLYCCLIKWMKGNSQPRVKRFNVRKKTTRSCTNKRLVNWYSVHNRMNIYIGGIGMSFTWSLVRISIPFQKWQTIFYSSCYLLHSTANERSTVVPLAGFMQCVATLWLLSAFFLCCYMAKTLLFMLYFSINK